MMGLLSCKKSEKGWGRPVLTVNEEKWLKKAVAGNLNKVYLIIIAH